MIDGQEINDIRTIGSMYNMGSVRVYIGEKEYRLKVQEIIKMVNYFDFDEIKKKKHTYLEVV